MDFYRTKINIIRELAANSQDQDLQMANLLYYIFSKSKPACRNKKKIPDLVMKSSLEFVRSIMLLIPKAEIVQR